MKTIVVLVGFLIFAILMFLFGYAIIGDRNRALADTIAQQRVQLESLQREQKSFEQGKKDLAELQKSIYPPDDLFSRDTKLVKEIQGLEDLALKYNLELSITLSGNIKTATKATGVTGELYVIPYSIYLTGDPANVMEFIQMTEHLTFITRIQNVSISAVAGTGSGGSKDGVRAVLSSEFYIKK